MKYPEYTYPNTPRKGYILGEGEGTAYILPVCNQCGRYVKMDSSIRVNGLGELSKEPNATCSRCGRVHLGIEYVD